MAKIMGCFCGLIDKELVEDNALTERIVVGGLQPRFCHLFASSIEK